MTFWPLTSNVAKGLPVKFLNSSTPTPFTAKHKLHCWYCTEYTEYCCRVQNSQASSPLLVIRSVMPAGQTAVREEPVSRSRGSKQEVIMKPKPAGGGGANRDFQDQNIFTTVCGRPRSNPVQDMNWITVWIQDHQQLLDCLEPITTSARFQTQSVS